MKTLSNASTDIGNKFHKIEAYRSPDASRIIVKMSLSANRGFKALHLNNEQVVVFVSVTLNDELNLLTFINSSRQQF